MRLSRFQAWLSWGMVLVLALPCATLAVLQYRWITEISDAGRARLRNDLQQGLNQLARAFQADVNAAVSSVRNTPAKARPPLIRSLGRTSPRGNEMTLEMWDFTRNRFQAAEWPDGWRTSRDLLAWSLPDGPRRPLVLPGPAAPLLYPRSTPGRPQVTDWLVVELDLDYIRHSLLPALLTHYLGTERGPVQAELVSASDPSIVLYSSGPNRRIGPAAEAEVYLLGTANGSPSGPPPRWRLNVRYPPGSLDTIVARARYWNLAVSLGILLLIVAAGAALVRSARRAQQLAEQQINFAASVSHELRTPLTVIRTAAYNLRGKIGRQPEQVEKYGRLIESESEKLGILVERALLFAGMNAGKGLSKKELIDLGSLITNSVSNRRGRAECQDVVFEDYLEPGLPPVVGDSVALAQALENLIENAIKYGTDGSNWIGVSARRRREAAGDGVEIRVADRGPGIPADEQKHVFEPFFRGRQAVRDQAHGTGLGLNLVRRIVEAHGGSVAVNSAPGLGTEFAVRLPAAPPELQDEFAHSAD